MTTPQAAGACAPRVGLVSCLNIPEPDEDEAILVAALGELHVHAEVVAWNDPDLQVIEHDLLILRSCWDYHEPIHRAHFQEWTTHAAASTLLLNPLPVIRWNSDKRYLLELARTGIPVVPTRYVQQGTTCEIPPEWNRVVIKPAISAGSRETHLIDVGSGTELTPAVRDLIAREDVLVQEYVRSVDSYGERCLVWIDGTLCHAIRKEPRFTGDHESVSLATTISVTETEFAERVLSAAAACGGFSIDDLLYARIDLAPDDDGMPMLMELELIEPSLFLRHYPLTLTRFATSIAQRAAARVTPAARD